MLKKTSLIMPVMLALSVAPAAQAYDMHVESGYYSWSGSTQRSVFLTYMSLDNNLEAYRDAVVIPETINYQGRDIPVRGVGDHALFNCQYVTSLSLPEGVSYILDQAMSHCYYMTSVSLPASLEKIGDYAFEYCEDLTEVTIPAKVSEFGYGVFTYCKGMREYKVDPANTILEAIDGNLYMKGGNVLVQYAAGKEATTFTVPESVTMISDYAFSPAPSLAIVSLGANVGMVDAATFADATALQTIEVSSENAAMTAVEGVLFTKDISQLITYPQARQNDEYKVPETVKALGDMSFKDTSWFYELTLPASLEQVGAFAFSGARIANLTVLATNPPATDLMPFDDAMTSATVLYVPEESVDKYKRDTNWGQFRDIRAIGSGAIESFESANSGVTVEGRTISAPGQTLRAYTPDGRLVATGTDTLTLPAGIYIVHTATTAIRVSL